MQKYVQTLSESMIDGISEHYAIQDSATPMAMTDFGNAEDGQVIYPEGIPAKGISACASCHGNAGVTIDGSVPVIRGMNANYIYKELENYKLGERSNDQDRSMRSVSEKWEDPEMKDLAAYLSTF